MKIKKYLPHSLRLFINRTFIKPRWAYLLFGNTNPVSMFYGFDRGLPIDRYYIEEFLEQNKQYIKGVCLEVQDDGYCKKYGQDRVIKQDILDIVSNNKKATIIADIKDLSQIKDFTYDCIVLTQVLQYVDDLDGAIAECKRVLKNQGVLLVTLPSAAKIDPDAGTKNDYWRFTEASAKYLFSKYFESSKLEIKTHGNAALLWQSLAGFSQQDTYKKFFKMNNPAFPLIVTVRGIKAIIFIPFLNLFSSEMFLNAAFWG